MYPENRHGRVHSAPWRRPPRPALGSRPGTWPGPPACPRRRSIAGADSACYPSTRSIAEAPGVEWRCGRRTRRNRRPGCSSSSKPGGPGTRSGRRSLQASSFPGETRRRSTPARSGRLRRASRGYQGRMRNRRPRSFSSWSWSTISEFWKSGPSPSEGLGRSESIRVTICWMPRAV